jgi:hypothetical protein
MSCIEIKERMRVRADYLNINKAKPSTKSTSSEKSSLGRGQIQQSTYQVTVPCLKQATLKSKITRLERLSNVNVNLQTGNFDL